MDYQIKRADGFTLIELIVAMVIAAILAAIAIPAYSSYVLRAHRTEAKTALLDLASLEERFLSTNGTYTTDATQLGYSTAFPVTVGSGYYTVNISNYLAAGVTTPASYTLTATAVNRQANDTACATFTLTSTGVQTSSSAAATTCWH
jgi:type IV pilus assembly protein PilE